MRVFLRRVKKFFVFLYESIILVLFYPLSCLFNGNKKIYLFSERGHEARDNGYHLFKYFCQNHPELECYYVLDRKSQDLQKVSELGKTVYFGSLKHHIIFYSAHCCISTHIYGYTPNIDFYARLFRAGLFSKKKTVSIKHGISQNDSPQLYAENVKLSLIISGARPEYEYFLEHFHYTADKLKYTGLARFDALYDFKIERQILVMPTWRNFLYLMNGREFLESDYYKRWSALLGDKELLSLLKQNGIKLVFYPHYEMQKYVASFKNISENIVIADKEHYDVQPLLKESALLITDYSSVFFDFAYMKKPSVYYQFDKEMFYGNHYKKGYFDHETMGFGEVTQSHDDLIDIIKSYVDNNFAMKPEYEKRASTFFELHDDRNCERICDEILKLG